ncbi:hypothetical protein [Enterobacter cloacae complex sp. GF14B]|uniref:hypothetical protein n=1 Tax=Enterobacter cloacae complex sp. GF14B TaxID=2511982 RepID=UPI00100FED61|nr:hypothetical protein [Enterobacter cloacae complex sp. GF14B]RYA37680.1 hypothetical protein DD606_26260 [Enterobacter cloacae complex sp. GF14B]
MTPKGEASGQASASSSESRVVPSLPKRKSSEAKRGKVAYRFARRIRMLPIHFDNPEEEVVRRFPCLREEWFGYCSRCFGRWVEDLPPLPVQFILKKLSTTGETESVGDEMQLNGVEFMQNADYGNYLQLLLAKRLGVVRCIAIIAYVLSDEEKVEPMKGDDLLWMCRLINTGTVRV